jgi:hypothetical protein
MTYEEKQHLINEHAAEFMDAYRRLFSGETFELIERYAKGDIDAQELFEGVDEYIDGTADHYEDEHNGKEHVHDVPFTCDNCGEEYDNEDEADECCLEDQWWESHKEDIERDKMRRQP